MNRRRPLVLTWWARGVGQKMAGRHEVTSCLSKRPKPRSNLKWFKTDRPPNERHTDGGLSDFHYSVTNRWQASNTHIMFIFFHFHHRHCQFWHCNHAAVKLMEHLSLPARHPSVSIRRRHTSCVRRLCLELILVTRTKETKDGGPWEHRDWSATSELLLFFHYVWENGDWRLNSTVRRLGNENRRQSQDENPFTEVEAENKGSKPETNYRDTQPDGKLSHCWFKFYFSGHSTKLLFIHFFLHHAL